MSKSLTEPLQLLVSKCTLDETKEFLRLMRIQAILCGKLKAQPNEKITVDTEDHAATMQTYFDFLLKKYDIKNLIIMQTVSGSGIEVYLVPVDKVAVYEVTKK